MIILLIVWGIGLLIFSIPVIRYQTNNTDERFSFMGVVFILVLWPLTIISTLFMLAISLIEDKYTTDDYTYSNKREDDK